MAPSAMAVPPPVDLRWQAPPGCPQQSEVRERIQKLLGPTPQQGHVSAEGSVVRSEGRFRLELVVRVGDLVGTRTIDADSCKDLAGAAAVALGLLLHSEERGTGQPAEPTTKAPSSSGEPARSAAEQSARPPSSTPEVSPLPAPIADATPVLEKPEQRPAEATSARHWRALLQAPFATLEVGPLPKPSLGVGLSGGLAFANLQLQLQAIVWQRQSISAQDFPGFGADVDRIAAAFWACRAFRVSSWLGLSPCLTLGIERVSASGTGRNVAQSTARAIGMSAGAGGQARVNLTSWMSILAAVGGQLQLSRPRLSIDSVGSVYDFTPVALTTAIGLEWIL